ncbi:hypothetical protein SDC9_110832 [bioreactor metagenome]|uniref:Transposase IS4-like domain-containing protein n=1 Tax=bioreactor metagenome TaxID=1076179 RepID=A0A645BF38_9ZZZZ
MIAASGQAIAHPVDSRLLEVARRQLVQAARAVGITFKQAYHKECAALRRKAGGYAHARQFKRMRRIVKRQRAVLGILLRECERKLYALHAPEVECIGKGKARKPYEFGVKVSVAITHRQGLVVGARSFADNPYDGHILNAQLEQSRILLEDVSVKPVDVVVDLGFRGVDWENPDVEIIYRGKLKQWSAQQRQWLRRRQAVEPVIGYLKDDNGMRRCWLKGALGDALNAVLCAAGYNLRWLMRAVVRLGLRAFAALVWICEHGGAPTQRDGECSVRCLMSDGGAVDSGVEGLDFAGATMYQPPDD